MDDDASTGAPSVAAVPSADWVRSAAEQTREELALFLRTMLAFTLHPRRFMRGWLDGTRKALNPFGFAATAVGVLSAIRAGAGALLHDPDRSDGLSAQVLSSILPSVYFAVLGAVAHGILRLLGSPRPLRDSVAVALYAAGPALAAQMVADVFAVLYLWTFHESINRSGIVVYLFIAFLVSMTVVPFVLALRETHGGARFPLLAAIFAFATAVALLAFGFGAFDPPGSYGMHPTIKVERSAGRVHFGFEVSD